MNDSPLELYHRAYNLHYKDNNIGEASNLYKNIIDQFPEDNVSAYASIQLQKIYSNNITKKIALKQESHNSGVLISLLIILFLLTTALIVSGVLFYNNFRKHKKYSNELSQALSKMSYNRNSDALDILDHIKSSYPDNLTPFILSADIHLKNGDYNKAVKEYEYCRHLFPDKRTLQIKVAKINRERKRFNESPDKKTADNDKKENQTQENSGSEIDQNRKSPSSANKKRDYPQRRTSPPVHKNEIKNKMLHKNNDTISFF